MIISAGVDGSVHVWKELDEKVCSLERESALTQFTCVQVIKDHAASSVNCIAVLPQLLVTGSSSGLIRIYRLADEYALIQTLRISSFYPLVLALHERDEALFLAIGGSSYHVHLYVSPCDLINFSPAAILKGHEDWVRGLSFTHSVSDIILASASQDRYVRLWKITPSVTSRSPPTDTDALFVPLQVLC